MSRKQLITKIDEFDLNHDGLADVTVIMKNGEKGIYVSFRAILAIAAACVAAVTGVIEQIL